MRAGLSTIQQTLTPEAATVLTLSIAEAARRNHGQTTPLHVASTLLAAPNGLLRQACVRSHPNSSHPLQCRALELCFSVALDRLPSNPNPSSNSNSSSSSANSSEPPISNALMAALKRAQAHQRRGCPETQQSPLLAVKVELEQLIVSILDDPSVSRVMKEASFSSPAVKATIEQSLASTSTPSAPNSASVARNLYMNPRLQRPGGNGGGGGGEFQRKEEVRRVLEILARTQKRNPVLVGDSDLNSVVKEVLERIETSDGPVPLRSAKVVSFEKELGSSAADRSQIPAKIRELGVLIESQIRSSASGGGGVIVDLGDLKWLVESNGGFGGSGNSTDPIQERKVVSEMGRAAVAEMGRIVGRFGDGGECRVWVVGTATCATYLRCQVYHPTMESEWDLQAVPIAPRSPMPGLFPRLGSNGILSSSVEALAPPKGFPPLMKPATIPLRRPPEVTADAPQKPTLCSQCMDSYERELAKLVAKEFEKSSSNSRPEARSALPQWLQIAIPGSPKPSSEQLQTKDNELDWKQSVEELLKRWRQTCARLHPTSFNPRTFQPKLFLSQNFPPLQLVNSADRPTSPPGSPVKTDLVLGHPKPCHTLSSDRAHRERVKDFPGCKQDKFSDQRSDDKVATFQDSDSPKRLFKGLMDKVSWQPEAASAITAAVMNSKSGNGKRRGNAPKADTWLLFMGPDKVGKTKMAHALSELLFGTCPITVCLGSPQPGNSDGRDPNVHFRGRTALDRVAEAVRQNPFSVIVLEDIDRADVVVRGTIKRAIERGRLPDSHGREIGLGSAIFVLVANWLPDELRNSDNSLLQLEEKILNSTSSGWQLELSVGEKHHRPEWLSENNQPAKRRKECNGLSLSLDLNLATGGSGDDETGEGSWNSSDVTVEHGHEHARLAIKHTASSSASELTGSVDDAIVFKPVDFGPLRRRISESVSAKFTEIAGGRRSLRIDDNVLDRMTGGVWLGGAVFEEWTERVLVPGIERLKDKLRVDDGVTVRLSMAEGSIQSQRSAVAGDQLPSTVRVAGDPIGGV